MCSYVEVVLRHAGLKTVCSGAGKQSKFVVVLTLPSSWTKTLCPASSILFIFSWDGKISAPVVISRAALRSYPKKLQNTVISFVQPVSGAIAELRLTSIWDFDPFPTVSAPEKESSSKLSLIPNKDLKTLLSLLWASCVSENQIFRYLTNLWNLDWQKFGEFWSFLINKTTQMSYSG